MDAEYTPSRRVAKSISSTHLQTPTPPRTSQKRGSDDPDEHAALSTPLSKKSAKKQKAALVPSPQLPKPSASTGQVKERLLVVEEEQEEGEKTYEGLDDDEGEEEDENTLSCSLFGCGGFGCPRCHWLRY